MRRIMENTGVALLVLSFVFAGCGSSTGTKEQPVASKEVQLEDTKGIKVDIVNEKYEGDCHILGDTVMSCKKHDKTVYYQWKNNSYQECASEVFSKVITEEGNQHKIRFSYFIGKDRIYIADKTCSQQYDEVYGMQDNTKEVLLVLFTQLNGWTPTKSGRGEDPLNFKKIDIKSIAETLNLDKKDVKKSISKLVGEFLLEPGDSDTVKNGYRFSF